MRWRAGVPIKRLSAPIKPSFTRPRAPITHARRRARRGGDSHGAPRARSSRSPSSSSPSSSPLSSLSPLSCLSSRSSRTSRARAVARRCAGVLAARLAAGGLRVRRDRAGAVRAGRLLLVAALRPGRGLSVVLLQEQRRLRGIQRRRAHRDGDGIPARPQHHARVRPGRRRGRGARRGRRRRREGGKEGRRR